MIYPHFPILEDYDRLEKLIDRVGAAEVLEMLSNIAYEKADHTLTSYNDKNLSAYWTKLGAKVRRLASWVREN